MRGTEEAHGASKAASATLLLCPELPGDHGESEGSPVRDGAVQGRRRALSNRCSENVGAWDGTRLRSDLTASFLSHSSHMQISPGFF